MAILPAVLTLVFLLRLAAGVSIYSCASGHCRHYCRHSWSDDVPHDSCDRRCRLTRCFSRPLKILPAELQAVGQRKSDMGVTTRNVVLNLLYYAVTLVGLPCVMLFMEDRIGLRRVFLPLLSIPAVVLALAGAALQLWCITVFQRTGKGTPSPLSPPGRLVTVGPYRWLRNPMNVGEVVLFLALAAWFGSPALLAYALAAWFAFHAFVVYYEEPRLARRFGDRYESYRHAVGRWLPRISNTESQQRRPDS